MEERQQNYQEKKLLKQHKDPSEIKYKTDTEKYCEQSSASNHIDKISNVGSLISGNSGKALAQGFELAGKREIAQNIRNATMGTTAGFAAGEIGAEAQTAG